MNDLTTTNGRGLALTTFSDYHQFAVAICKGGFAPRGLDKPEAVAVAMAFGAELGLSPLSAIQNIAVVNGRPCVWGDAALALVKQSGLCGGIEETVSGDGDKRTATCTVTRRGEEGVCARTFSVADAKRANLWGKQGPWTQYPDRMLAMRARGFALRDAFPDVLRGLITREEAQDYPQDAARPVVDVTPQETAQDDTQEAQPAQADEGAREERKRLYATLKGFALNADTMTQYRSRYGGKGATEMSLEELAEMVGIIAADLEAANNDTAKED